MRSISMVIKSSARNAGDFSSAEFIKFYDAVGDGTYTHTDTPDSKDIWYYWLVVVSNSNNDSPPFGPLTTANTTLKYVLLA